VHHVDPFGASCPGQVDCGNCNWKTAQGKTGENFAAARMGQTGQVGQTASNQRSAYQDETFDCTYMTFTNMARPDVISMIFAFTS